MHAHCTEGSTVGGGSVGTFLPWAQKMLNLAMPHISLRNTFLSAFRSSDVQPFRHSDVNVKKKQNKRSCVGQVLVR